MKTTIYLFIAYLFIAIAITGCSTKPSNSEIEQQVVDNLLRDSGVELFKVENFEKVNGFEKSSNTYIADVKYDLVFKKSIKELTQQLKEEAKDSPLSALGSGLGVVALQMKYGNFKAGQRVTKEDKITFIKTEKGWRISQEL